MKVQQPPSCTTRHTDFAPGNCPITGYRAWSLLAALALYLLAVISPGAMAWAGDEQEIGVPVAMESRTNDCFGAYLSPNDDRFYTLREGVLTQYQINPFKKLGSVAIERTKIKEKPESLSGCRVLITNDEKKLIVVFYNWIYAFDTGTGQMLNYTKRKGYPYPAVIINNDELLILEKYFIGDENNGEHVADLSIHDIDTLTLKQKMHRFAKDFGFIQDAGEFPTMTKIQDRIYMRTYKSLLVVNSKTFAPELSFLIGLTTPTGAIIPAYFSGPLRREKLSKDFRRLYVRGVHKITDYLTNKQASFDEVKDDSVMAFDLATREFSIDSINKLLNDDLDFIMFGSTPMSRNRNYVMSSSSLYSALVNLRTGLLSHFYQYEHSKAIMLVRAITGKDNNASPYFQLTSGARKYLIMKGSANTPINDATFMKYHRTEASE